jgi:general secretion pathway protein M
MAGLDQLSPRERRLATIFGGAAGLMLVIAIPTCTASRLADRAHKNDEIRQAIADVNAARGRLAQKRAALGDVAMRYANKAPPLGTLVDNAAKASGIVIDVQTDVPPVPRGKLYSERATKLSVQKTGLKALATFLERIETSGNPVAVTAFDMSKRIEPDAYQVSMTIAAWDRAEPASASPASSASSASGGAR